MDLKKVWAERLRQYQLLIAVAAKQKQTEKQWALQRASGKPGACVFFERVRRKNAVRGKEELCIRIRLQRDF